MSVDKVSGTLKSVPLPDLNSHLYSQGPYKCVLGDSDLRSPSCHRAVTAEILFLLELELQSRLELQ